MNSKNTNPKQIPGGKIAACVIGLALCATAAAQSETGAGSRKNLEGNSLEIVTSALGAEFLKNYSANQNALGVGFNRVLGVEASYFDLGYSKYAVVQKGDAGNEDNLGGRIDLKVALDVSAPLTTTTRVFSRVGMYYWDVDVNYNRVSRDLDSSQAGNGQVMSVGAAYDARDLRLSLELEQVNPDAVIAQRDTNRVLFNVTSKF